MPRASDDEEYDDDVQEMQITQARARGGGYRTGDMASHWNQDDASNRVTSDLFGPGSMLTSILNPNAAVKGSGVYGGAGGARGVHRPDAFNRPGGNAAPGLSDEQERRNSFGSFGFGGVVSNKPQVRQPGKPSAAQQVVKGAPKSSSNLVLTSAKPEPPPTRRGNDLDYKRASRPKVIGVASFHDTVAEPDGDDVVEIAPDLPPRLEVDKDQLGAAVMDFLCYEFVTTLLKEWQTTEKLAWLRRKIRRMDDGEDEEGDTDKDLDWVEWDDDEHGTVIDSEVAKARKTEVGKVLFRQMRNHNFKERVEVLQAKLDRCHQRVEDIGKMIRKAEKEYPIKDFLHEDQLEKPIAPCLPLRYHVMELLQSWVQWRPLPAEDDDLQIIEATGADAPVHRDRDFPYYKSKWEDLPKVAELTRTRELLVQLTAEYYQLYLADEIGPDGEPIVDLQEDGKTPLPSQKLQGEWFELVGMVMNQIAIWTLIERFKDTDPKKLPGRRELAAILMPIYDDSHIFGNHLFSLRQPWVPSIGEAAKENRAEERLDIMANFVNEGVEGMHKMLKVRYTSYQKCLREIESFLRMVWDNVSNAPDEDERFRARHIGKPVLIDDFKGKHTVGGTPYAGLFHSFKDLHDETRAKIDRLSRDPPSKSGAVPMVAAKNTSTGLKSQQPKPKPVPQPKGMSGSATRVLSLDSDDDGNGGDDEDDWEFQPGADRKPAPKPKKAQSMGKKTVEPPKRGKLTDALSTGANGSNPKPDPAAIPRTGWMQAKKGQSPARAPEKGTAKAASKRKGSAEPSEQESKTMAMMLTGYRPKPAEAAKPKEEPLHFKKLPKEGSMESGSDEGSSVSRNVDQFMGNAKGTQRRSTSPHPGAANQKRGSTHLRYHSSGDEVTGTRSSGDEKLPLPNKAQRASAAVLVADSDEEKDEVAGYSSPPAKKKQRYGD